MKSSSHLSDGRPKISQGETTRYKVEVSFLEFDFFIFFEYWENFKSIFFEQSEFKHQREFVNSWLENFGFPYFLLRLVWTWLKVRSSITEKTCISKIVSSELTYTFTCLLDVHENFSFFVHSCSGYFSLNLLSFSPTLKPS